MPAHWFDRFANIKASDPIRLVGHTRGMVTLTRDVATDEHTLWLYDHPLATGPAQPLRAQYAGYVSNLAIAQIYR